jgi:selenocysteine lyase/cysteine desulfurase
MVSDLESYFRQFRESIIGIDSSFESPYGIKKIVYADWIASGRLYVPIEERIIKSVGPFVGNTHSEASETGCTMTNAYRQAQKIIKAHVNASEEDVILTTGTGMTGCITKLQRILGIKIPEQIKSVKCQSKQEKCNYTDNLDEADRPVVFLTHIEHHSNHTSWLETIADVVVLNPSEDLLVNPNNLKIEIEKYANRKVKIGSFSACSNVTGYIPPYHQLAKIMHEYGGICFIDFAASAPYLPINMHPEDPLESLDGIFFSPHKFLGGPGSSGVLIFNRNLYKNDVPDQPGGGTVKWTNRWGKYSYISDIEVREDGGTPGFLQAIKAAMAIKLKEEMGTEKIHAREQELIDIAFTELRKIKGLHILADNIEDRLGVFSLYIDGIHHNLVVRLLNDRFGIQARGGCSCAGTYGHFLLHVDKKVSQVITDRIEQGDLSLKPGWVRISLHPTMTSQELRFIIDSLKQIVEKAVEWQKDYDYSNKTNEFYHKTFKDLGLPNLNNWFDMKPESNL